MTPPRRLVGAEPERPQPLRGRFPLKTGGGAHCVGGSRFRLFAVLAFGVLACGALTACGGPQFSISGTITLASNLNRKAVQENSVLFVVALNRGGVPVAVRRIVNPQFPVSFTMTPEDLIVPAPKGQEPLLLRVQMNSHGNVGTPLRGDLEGALPDPVSPVSHGVHIVIDRQV